MNVDTRTQIRMMDTPSLLNYISELKSNPSMDIDEDIMLGLALDEYKDRERELSSDQRNWVGI